MKRGKKKKVLNAKLEHHIARPHTLSQEISAYIYIYIYMLLVWNFHVYLWIWISFLFYRNHYL